MPYMIPEKGRTEPSVRTATTSFFFNMLSPQHLGTSYLYTREYLLRLFHLKVGDICEQKGHISLVNKAHSIGALLLLVRL